MAKTNNDIELEKVIERGCGIDMIAGEVDATFRYSLEKLYNEYFDTIKLSNCKLFISTTKICLPKQIIKF